MRCQLRAEDVPRRILRGFCHELGSLQSMRRVRCQPAVPATAPGPAINGSLRHRRICHDAQCRVVSGRGQGRKWGMHILWLAPFPASEFEVHVKVRFNCGDVVEIGRTVARTETCPHCGADLHCCLNCRFHERFAHQQCREPQAEPVSQKDQANFCEYFVCRESDRTGKPGTSSCSSKEKLDQLFRKGK